MRILYNSKDLYFKRPFGAVKTEQLCDICILIPRDCPAEKVWIILENIDVELEFEMKKIADEGDYVKYKVEFSISEPGVYFYWFYIRKKSDGFRLFKQGNDTNMEDGNKWQITCYNADYKAPEWAKGAVFYQIFPDRFCIGGKINTEGKLLPFSLHNSTDETPNWFPDPNGNWNNDFFGGNFSGIIDKLDYLDDLGIDIIYLNPIVKAFSNHRYDAADYKAVDPMLGTVDDFKKLCDEAHLRNIKIIIDCVFSHTGNKSIYFEDTIQNENSSYREWYDFEKFPDKYRCWWGINTLPQIKRNHLGFSEFIAGEKDSVIDFWFELGVDGIRLDVADELTDDFIKKIFIKSKKIKPESFVIGEVWEDASNKISYGEKRKYLLGNELDSVMNYPFLSIICNFVKEKITHAQFSEEIMTIVENYPEEIMHCCMNILSTHDTMRIITRLGTENADLSKEEKANHKLNRPEVAEKLVKVAAFLQFMLPGSPSIYYGDEIGMEGFEDPFNRRFFNWSSINCELRQFFKNLCKLKHSYQPLKKGSIRFNYTDSLLEFSRSFGDEIINIAINMSNEIFQFDKKPIFSENFKDGKLRKYGFLIYQ